MSHESFLGYVAAAPVTAVFLQERHRLERFHSIEEEYPVEVIVLVLDHARREVAGADLDAAPLAIVGLDPDLARARHAAADVGNAEAAFPILGLGVTDDGDLGIDQR